MRRLDSGAQPHLEGIRDRSLQGPSQKEVAGRTVTPGENFLGFLIFSRNDPQTSESLPTYQAGRKGRRGRGGTEQRKGGDSGPTLWFYSFEGLVLFVFSKRFIKI